MPDAETGLAEEAVGEIADCATQEHPEQNRPR